MAYRNSSIVLYFSGRNIIFLDCLYQSLYSRVKLLVPGPLQIISSVFTVLYQTSTSSHNMTWIVWKWALSLMPAEGGLFWKPAKDGMSEILKVSLWSFKTVHTSSNGAKFTKLFISLTQIADCAQGQSPSQNHLVQMHNFICRTGCIWQREQ